MENKVFPTWHLPIIWSEVPENAKIVIRSIPPRIELNNGFLMNVR